MSKKVNVYDDAEMVSLGLRLPVRSERDASIWVKTEAEIKSLKKMKHDVSFASARKPNHNVGIKHVLSIHLKNNKKSTVSYRCYINEITGFLRLYKQSDIISYTYNGHKYDTVANAPVVHLGRNMRHIY